MKQTSWLNFDLLLALVFQTVIFWLEVNFDDNQLVNRLKWNPLCKETVNYDNDNDEIWHDRARKRILSSRGYGIFNSFAELTRARRDTIAHQQSKIKFVSPRGHVISSKSLRHNSSSQRTFVCLMSNFVVNNVFGQRNFCYPFSVI